MNQESGAVSTYLFPALSMLGCSPGRPWGNFQGHVQELTFVPYEGIARTRLRERIDPEKCSIRGLPPGYCSCCAAEAQYEGSTEGPDALPVSFKRLLLHFPVVALICSSPEAVCYVSKDVSLSSSPLRAFENLYPTSLARPPFLSSR